MNHALTFALLLAALGVGGLPGCASTDAAISGQPADAKPVMKPRVVFHVTEDNPQKWNIVLNNVSNVQKDLGRDNVIIEIVTHGPGINMLKAESKVSARLATALDSNIGLLACENTMEQAKVTRADMYGGISYAPSGVTHIIKRQREGWYYLRP